MPSICITREVAASQERVFETVAYIDNFRNAVADIVRVEFLSESKSGVGTRFRETRLMRGREASSVLEVTEFESPRRVRLISESGGTVWDSCFVVTGDDARCTLELTMDARPQGVAARLFTPLIMGVVKKAVAKDMDAVKAVCESSPVES